MIEIMLRRYRATCDYPDCEVSQEILVEWRADFEKVLAECKWTVTDDDPPFVYCPDGLGGHATQVRNG